MSLRRLYVLWSVSTGIAIAISIVFFLVAMKISYGNFSGHEDFDGLVYFIEAFILAIFFTGALSALLVLIDKSSNKRIDKLLAKKIFIFYSIFALFCIVTFNFAFIYLYNPLSFFIFAIIPKLTWDATHHSSKAKKQAWFFAGLILAIVVLGALTLLNIILSDPYR
jgi:hypothetical protein